MQAIHTYRLPQTEKSPSRIKAQCFSRSRIYSWDYDLNTEENHVYAAEKLAQELGWWEGLVWVAGGLKDGSYAHVAHPQKVR